MRSNWEIIIYTLDSFLIAVDALYNASGNTDSPKQK